MGPKTAPWGTPDLTRADSDNPVYQFLDLPLLQSMEKPESSKLGLLVYISICYIFENERAVT